MKRGFGRPLVAGWGALGKPAKRGGLYAPRALGTKAIWRLLTQCGAAVIWQCKKALTRPPGVLLRSNPSAGTRLDAGFRSAFSSRLLRTAPGGIKSLSEKLVKIGN